MNIAFARLRTAALAGAFVLAGTLAAQAETVLNRGNGAEPETLDPQKLTGVPEANITYDLFEGLVTTGPARPGRRRARRKSWTVSDDGLIYTFNLREDGKWSNGEPLTADDFVYSLRRLVDPATAADYGYILVADDERRGHQCRQDAGRSARRQSGRSLHGEDHAESSTPYFPALLAHSFLPSSTRRRSRSSARSGPGRATSVGNGAYTVAEWMPQSTLVLVKNPNFHDAANVKLDKIVYYPTEDLDEEYKRFRAGEFDVTYDVPSEQIKYAAAEHRRTSSTTRPISAPTTTSST